jgi:hypothetical protein
VLALTFVPAIVIVLVSPVVSYSFPPLDALVYALCAFAGASVFFSLAFLFSSMFSNVWIPALLALCAGPVLAALDRVTGSGAFSLLEMMHGRSYFSGQGVPWPMLLVSVALSSALIYSGVRLMARQDF